MENMQDSAKLFLDSVERINSATKWCAICHYPLDTDGICQNCRSIEVQKQIAVVQRREYDIKRLGGIRAYEDYTEEKFDSKYYDAKETLKRLKASGNLYIFGPRGVGKTHAACICVRANQSGRIATPTEILRRTKGAALDAGKEMQIIQEYINRGCICIDDIGTEKLTSYTRSILYEIIDGRWRNKSKGLIITSNLNLDELSIHLEDDRIASRIAGMCDIIQFAGKDRRIYK